MKSITFCTFSDYSFCQLIVKGLSLTVYLMFTEEMRKSKGFIQYL